MTPTLSPDPAGHGYRIDFASPSRLLSIVFALLWFSGWGLLLALTALDYARFGGVHLVGIITLAAGLPVALALVWLVTGKRESLRLNPSEVRIDRWAGPIPLSRKFEVHDIGGVRVVEAPAGFFADFVALRQFYSGGSGRLGFDTNRGTFTVGSNVSREDARALIEQIRQHAPQLSAVPDESPRPGLRLANRAAPVMTMAMVGFALNVPFKLAIVDRPICFYNDAARPREPIDVSGRRPSGQVYLVPVDDFPVDRARAIAEHFRTRFGVVIDVAPALEWPPDAYVSQRRQMNAAVMLTRLEELYPATDRPVIAIALTTRDMFNPDVGWRYVFSYRRNNRVAVVSPARMDRGCLGLFPAGDDRIMTRLRKMVGKNIGIMSFRLDPNNDPASMLYANIGGPQELDAMSEFF